MLSNEFSLPPLFFLLPSRPERFFESIKSGDEMEEGTSETARMWSAAPGPSSSPNQEGETSGSCVDEAEAPWGAAPTTSSRLASVPPISPSLSNTTLSVFRGVMIFRVSSDTSDTSHTSDARESDVTTPSDSDEAATLLACEPLLAPKRPRAAPSPSGRGGGWRSPRFAFPLVFSFAFRRDLRERSETPTGSEEEEEEEEEEGTTARLMRPPESAADEEERGRPDLESPAF